MRLSTRSGFVLFGLILVVLGGFVFLLFDGELDYGGQYEILQTVSYSPNRIAFEVQRTDNQALNGPRYAVLIRDHVPSTRDMKHAIISFWRNDSFSIEGPQVSIQWLGPNLLNLTATRPGSNPDWVVDQKHSMVML